MKFLFAPDSFKGSLTAVQITQMLDIAAKQHFPGCETVAIPVADGGEGTVDALVTAGNGEYQTATVTGPMGDPVRAHYGLLDHGRTAVIEMAQASGLPLVQGDLSPLKASSRGTGELIALALEQGVQHILMGIGGSATNDGGMGMLCALGARFLDEKGAILYGRGEDMAKVAQVDLSQLHPALQCVSIQVICDVTNPLLGLNGATAIYGPQKGVTAPLQPILENAMAHYAAKVEQTLGRNISAFPGAGAAGGMGAALGGVLNAAICSGIDAILDAVNFDERLTGCDLVITGEGRLDGQSVRFGKAPAGVAKRCARKGIPVLAIVGGMGPGAEAYYQLGLTSILTTINSAMPIQYAIKNAAALYQDAAERAFRLLRMGWQIPNNKESK